MEEEEPDHSTCPEQKEEEQPEKGQMAEEEPDHSTCPEQKEEEQPEKGQMEEEEPEKNRAHISCRPNGKNQW